MFDGWELRYSASPMQPVHLELARQPESDSNQIVLRLDGKLSLETVHNFIQTLRPEPAAHVILDMSGVSFLDSAGVGALVQIFVHRRSKGQTFSLTGLTKQGSAVMQVAGLTKLLPIYGTVADAIAARPA
jgi:anti-sigma B factor antagonist